MRRFRFIGDPKEYHWDQRPKTGDTYVIEEINDMWGGGDFDDDDISEWGKNDWQEVFENDGGTMLTTPKTLHKDTDLGYFSGLAMIGLLSNRSMIDNVERPSIDWLTDCSISISKELIKQLNEENK